MPASDIFAASAGGVLRTLEIVEALKADLGVPVVASTPASVWQMLRILGISAPRERLGRLLQEFPPLPPTV